MKILLTLLSILFYVLTVPVSSYSDDWKAKKWPAAKTNPGTQSGPTVQGYQVDSQANNHTAVYIPGQRPPLDLSDSNQETITFPQEAPAPMTVSFPENSHDTVTIPDSNPYAATPIPGSGETEDTVETPHETGP